MKTLTKSEIAALPRAPIAIPVPALGDDCGVYARLLSGREREELVRVIRNIESDVTVATHVLAACVCASDADESLMFADATEVESVIRNPDALSQICKTILRANGLLKDSLDDAKKN